MATYSRTLVLKWGKEFACFWIRGILLWEAGKSNWNRKCEMRELCFNYGFNQTLLCGMFIDDVSVNRIHRRRLTVSKLLTNDEDDSMKMTQSRRRPIEVSWEHLGISRPTLATCRWFRSLESKESKSLEPKLWSLQRSRIFRRIGIVATDCHRRPSEHTVNLSPFRDNSA